ncbi:MAG: metallophosphoesterase family protein [Deltaproteobacteria bacterium]|nr:metallophosphoesterase family protein [Deltaproteobacteria bacterium]
MRYAVISDVHSNLEAILAALKEIDSGDIDEIVCLGDIVGYHANPNECIEIIKDRGIKCIMGNHDARASGIEEPDDFTPLAREAVFWTRKQLKQENTAFLKGLPRSLSFHAPLEGRHHNKDVKSKKFVPAGKSLLTGLAVHGSINSTDEYIFSSHHVAMNFMRMEEKSVKICFFGHTHVRIAYVEDREGISIVYKNEIVMENNKRYLVNPGSVGQPRDGDSRAAFSIYDTDAEKLEFFRVQYDIDTCCEKIIKAGLPTELAERLKAGW